MGEIRHQQYQTWLEACERWREFEALSASEVQDHQLKELNAQLSYTLANSPFYSTYWASCPRNVSSLTELSKLPFTTKEDLRGGYPSQFVAAKDSLIIRYGESTGTTGLPTSSAITYRDWILCNVAVEASVGHLFGPADMVFVSIPYELAFASYDLDRALEAIGATVVSTGALTSVCPIDRVAQMMCNVHPAGLICTPTRALRIFDMIRDIGEDPRRVGLKTLLYVGETCSSAKLTKIGKMWSVDVATAYGATETNSLGLQCELGQLHLTEDRYIFEVIDPQTGQTVKDGSSGELVVTSIATEAMPLIRYRTGDEVTVSPSGSCACGSPRRTIQHHGRLSEGYAVGGRRLNKLAVEQQVLSTRGTGLYYAAGVEGDQLVVRVQVEEGALVEKTLRSVENSVSQAFSVPCRASSVSLSSIMAAMDQMLKPGSLNLEHLRAVE
ncbi:hypothetical protein HMPREF1531_00814 [Propionibacterium sp. oral taxon 192 str. F0372]|uniref:phenylacetate--CoA ligase family protein n=1 Tax=Propionibacterium sp. oral taxon 192 TaxID=671222 RepID=UPI000352F13E|nr:AMP-binding protein [Propionibacterium sp. oral taxon 192]EPH06165.1 hypothetical protein HMPREF1531_00814 [Propionibacterium sp. oral taxon 192 str. F0372]